MRGPTIKPASEFDMAVLKVLDVNNRRTGRSFRMMVDILKKLRDGKSVQLIGPNLVHVQHLKEMLVDQVQEPGEMWMGKDECRHNKTGAILYINSSQRAERSRGRRVVEYVDHSVWEQWLVEMRSRFGPYYDWPPGDDQPEYKGTYPI